MFRSAALLALLCALSGAGAAQSASSGVEGWITALARSTASRRAAAAEAWQTHGAAYLLDPQEALLAPLLAAAPEIQEPVLGAVDAWLGRAGAPEQELRRLLELLQRSMNAAGADQLVERLPVLPPWAVGLCLEGCVQAGSRRGLQAAGQALAAPAAEVRGPALRALCRFAAAGELTGWLASLSPEAWDGEALSAALRVLAERTDLGGGFHLPPAFLLISQPQVQLGVLQVLQRYPAEEAEDLALAIAVDRKAGGELRQAALRNLEQGVALFRWRKAPRDLAAFLRDYQRSDPLAEAVAWSLHRMGEKEGAKFLLAEPEAAVRADPKNFRALLRLGQVLVDLDRHKDAYKYFRGAIVDLEGTPSFERVTSQQWLYAARAAAGARHYGEAADWLANARMSPKELEPYRDLPEFEGALSRPAFKKLFGL